MFFPKDLITLPSCVIVFEILYFENKKPTATECLFSLLYRNNYF